MKMGAEHILDGRRLHKRADGRYIDVGPARKFGKGIEGEVEQRRREAEARIQAQAGQPQPQRPPVVRYRIYYKQDALPCEPMPSYPMKEPYEELEASMWGAGPGFLMFETPHGRVGIRADKVEEIRPIHVPDKEKESAVQGQP